VENLRDIPSTGANSNLAPSGGRPANHSDQGANAPGNANYNAQQNASRPSNANGNAASYNVQPNPGRASAGGNTNPGTNNNPQDATRQPGTSFTPGVQPSRPASNDPRQNNTSRTADQMVGNAAATSSMNANRNNLFRPNNSGSNPQQVNPAGTQGNAGQGQRNTGNPQNGQNHADSQHLQQAAHGNQPVPKPAVKPVAKPDGDSKKTDDGKSKDKTKEQ